MPEAWTWTIVCPDRPGRAVTSGTCCRPIARSISITDRLPADGLLRAAGDPIQDWWRRAYLEEAGAVLPRRFADEARASLPGLVAAAEPPPEERCSPLLCSSACG